MSLKFDNVVHDFRFFLNLADLTDIDNIIRHELQCVLQK